ncbi:g2454 [Coccomyxa viridis]|uniref:Ribosomal protein n=1 Tax=Coccomyxa viridis TaxID=1274662 RepID=A0ABP1FMP9_9CHLO
MLAHQFTLLARQAAIKLAPTLRPLSLGASHLAEPAALEQSPLILQANFSFPAEALQLEDDRPSSVSGQVPPAEAQASRNLPTSLEEVLEEYQPPARSPTNLPDWMTSKAPLIRAQPLTGLRMEDPMLPVPRFTPTVRKFRPQPIDLKEGLKKVKDEAKAKFNESVEIAINLGIDPRRGDQQVRGAVVLPHGTGTNTRVAVFAEDEAADLARSAGAEVVGSEDLIAAIQKGGAGAIDFDKCLATSAMMSKLARIARTLGPRGLMPNPKLGTIVEPSSIAEAVRTMKAGRVEFRADRGAVLHAAVGKVDFPVEHLHANLGALTAAILAARPKGIKGGGMTGYITGATLSSSMGRAVPVTLPSLQQAVAAAKRSA